MLADQADRDRIINYDGHIFIVAGAGTGKSTIIADKLLRLLEEGKLTGLKNVAAITYTNKAAAELKWKIEEKLYHKISETPSKELAAKLQRSLDSINECAIGTIHSFCVRLLRKYGYREKIDPMFSISSSEESEVMLREAFSKYLSRLDRENPEMNQTFKELLRLNRYDSLDALLEEIRSTVEKAHQLEELDEEAFPVQSAADLEKLQAAQFREHVGRFYEYLEHYDYAAEALENPKSLGGRLERLVEILQHGGNPLEEIRYDGDEILPGKFRGSKAHISKASPFENINNILKEYLLLFAGYPLGEKFPVKDDMAEHFTGKLFPGHCGVNNFTLENEYTRFLFFSCIKNFHDFFMNFKRQKSTLSYNDIVYYALRILKNDEVLKSVQKNYEYIFVDEYQDTDPVQTALFTKLAGTIYAPKQDRLEGDSSSPRLIRVGDAKQSIYGFRGADLETFYKEKELFMSHNSGHTGRLQVNMRSHPRVINFINRVFAPGPGHTPMDIAGYEPIVAGTSRSRLENPGVYVNHSAQVDDKSIRTSRRNEARWIAGEIKELLSKDQDLSICILFISMKNNLEPYVRQLKLLGIPFNLVGRRYYGENFTRKYLGLLLKFLYNPEDKISLVGFLRSPVAGFCDREVEQIVESGYVQKALGAGMPGQGVSEPDFAPNLAPDLLSKVAGFARLCQTCTNLARNQSLPAMLFYLFENSGFFAFTDMLKNRDIIKESIDRFLELAVSAEAISFATFSEKFKHFIAEIEKLENIPEVDESAEAYNAENAVQIMSYHKSKGLEFDMVFLADMAYSKTNRSDKLLLDTSHNSGESAKPPQTIMFQARDDLSWCKTGGTDTPAVLAGKKTRELIRLAYVAMTRARERLYLPLFDPLKKNESLLNCFHETFNEKFLSDISLDEQGDTWSPVEGTGTSEPVYYIRHYNPPESPGDEAEDEFDETLLLPRVAVEPVEVKSPPPVSYDFVSGTSIMKQLARQKNAVFDEADGKPAEGDFDEDLPLTEKNRLPLLAGSKNPLGDAITRGVIAHSVFELVDLKNPVVDKKILKALYFSHAFNETMQGHIEKYARELIEVYLKSELYPLIRSGEVIGKEVPFSQLFDEATENALPGVKKDSSTQKKIAVGYIDLVIKDAAGVIHIVDYKTNVQPQGVALEEFSRHLIRTYEIPMRLYQNTMEDVYPGTPVVLTLYHTPTGACFSY